MVMSKGRLTSFVQRMNRVETLHDCSPDITIIYLVINNHLLIVWSTIYSYLQTPCHYCRQKGTSLHQRSLHAKFPTAAAKLADKRDSRKTSSSKEHGTGNLKQLLSLWNPASMLVEEHSIQVHGGLNTQVLLKKPQSHRKSCFEGVRQLEQLEFMRIRTMNT